MFSQDDLTHYARGIPRGARVRLVPLPPEQGTPERYHSVEYTFDDDSLESIGWSTFALVLDEDRDAAVETLRSADRGYEVAS